MSSFNNNNNNNNNNNKININNLKRPSNQIIIIQKDKLGSEREGSVITYEKGDYKIQSNLSNTITNQNIENTVNDMKKTLKQIENSNNIKKNNLKNITDYENKRLITNNTINTNNNLNNNDNNDIKTNENIMTIAENNNNNKNNNNNNNNKNNNNNCIISEKITEINNQNSKQQSNNCVINDKINTENKFYVENEYNTSSLIENEENEFNDSHSSSNNSNSNKSNNNNNNVVHDIPFLPSNHHMKNTNVKNNLKKNKKTNKKNNKNVNSEHSQTLSYENQNNIISQNNLKNQRFIIVNTNNEYINNLNLYANNIVIYHNCFICNRTFCLDKLFNAECYKHFTCRRCTKNFFEEKIEEGEREFFCPVFKCNSPFKIENLKNIISKSYFNLITEKKNNNDNSNNKLMTVITNTNTLTNTNTITNTITNTTNDNKNNNKISYEKINIYKNKNDIIKKYIHKHVLDINSNENFYVFNKQKNQFCPNCYENTLFGKNGTHFIKCLNCFYRICKYCQKSFDEIHMDLNNENHCKVYFRRSEDLEEEMTLSQRIIIEFILVISSFLILILGGFIQINNLFKNIFCYKKINRKYKKFFVAIFIFLFTLILFLPYFALILISFPYFTIYITILN